MTAKQIGRISDEEWAALDSRTAKTMRNELGKTYNFSLIYFISPFGLRYNIEAKQGQLLDLDVIESRIESFFNLYPEIRHRHNVIRNFANDYQETFTLMGFRRPLNVERIRKTEMIKPYNRHKDKDALNATVTRAIEKKAINTECQGTTGEICVTALAILTKLISEHNLLNGHMKIVLTVHDSIYFEFTDDPVIVSTGLKLAQEVMTKTVFDYCYDKFHFNPLALTKISVEASLGYSLDDTLEIKGSFEIDNITKYLNKRDLFTLDSELVSKIKQGIDNLKTIY
jgi:DNA polymerase I-like protein with 3'-5' exonuclease and polymerase domains